MHLIFFLNPRSTIHDPRSTIQSVFVTSNYVFVTSNYQLSLCLPWFSNNPSNYNNKHSFHLFCCWLPKNTGLRPVRSAKRDLSEDWFWIRDFQLEIKLWRSRTPKSPGKTLQFSCFFRFEKSIENLPWLKSIFFADVFWMGLNLRFL